VINEIGNYLRQEKQNTLKKKISFIAIHVVITIKSIFKNTSKGKIT